MQKEKEKEENQKLKLLQEKRKQQVSSELEELMQQHKEIEDIFDVEQEGEEWYEKPKFKQMLDSLDTRRDLLKHTITFT